MDIALDKLGYNNDVGGLIDVRLPRRGSVQRPKVSLVQRDMIKDIMGSKYNSKRVIEC